MNSDTLIPVIFSPIIGAIVGFIFSRFGVSGKIRLAEYYLKKTELIEKLLANDHITVNRAHLEKDLNDIAATISLLSIADEEIAQIKYGERPLLKKILHLPKATTPAGVFATIFFYVYIITGAMYIVLIPGMRKEMGLGLTIFAMLMCFLIAFLCRLWAINSAYREAIVQRARRELLLNDKLTKKS